MKKLPAKSARPVGVSGGSVITMERRTPVADPWAYAYLITGEKKIGKTAFSIEGVEEYVMQCDKPQLAYDIREDIVTRWQQAVQIVNQLLEMATKGEMPFQRVVVDGAGELYAMCQTAACAHFGVEHPSEVGYARCWHKIRDDFTALVNKLLRLQRVANCGLVFIAHAEWKEKVTRDRQKIERFVPNLPAKCEEILNGKCDAWFTWDYVGKRRVMLIQGDELVAAGHRIDGHFLTPDGRRVREIYMGRSPAEAREAFEAAFRNEQTYTSIKELDGEAEPAKAERKGGEARPRLVRRKAS